MIRTEISGLKTVMGTLFLFPLVFFSGCQTSSHTVKEASAGTVAVIEVSEDENGVVQLEASQEALAPNSPQEEEARQLIDNANAALREVFKGGNTPSRK